MGSMAEDLIEEDRSGKSIEEPQIGDGLNARPGHKSFTWQYSSVHKSPFPVHFASIHPPPSSGVERRQRCESHTYFDGKSSPARLNIHPKQSFILPIEDHRSHFHDSEQSFIPIERPK